ncbi:MAG: RNA-binding protein [Akkermansiaceae bacterium]|nr:RNA-binding protein [Akkermansiaceae bacterium]
MSQENNNNSRNGGGQGRQGGNNRNRNQNQNRNRNRNRNNQGGQNRHGGGQRRRQPKPAPLTAWEKLLKFFGLYKAPTRPPRRRPESSGNAPKSNVRNARDNKQGDKKKQPSGPVPARGKGAGEKGKNFPVETPRLYVGNLSYDANEHDLEELFKGIGTVKNVEIIYNRHTHRSRGYGFIQMLNIDDAEKAVQVLHDQPFMGRDMIVNGASSKPAEADEDTAVSATE